MKNGNRRTPGLHIVTDMDNSVLHELFVSELKDIYWAEKYLVKTLPDISEACTSLELKRAIDNHRYETEKHVKRLEETFGSIHAKAEVKKCEAMEGIINETIRLLKETEEGTMVRDVAIIACAQKIEHYEIATYGTLRTLAAVMNHKEAEKLLGETLEEEKKADTLLSKLALSYINSEANCERK